MPLTPLGAAEFAARLDPLGPFEPCPRLAVAVSGGADSMALAVLASAWARAKGGQVIGAIVDHGLRREAGAESAEARSRLAAKGIAAEILRLDLPAGPAMAARARAARYAALEAFCAARGIVHLLLGHHANDQAETVVMRAMAGSHPAGLAGMAAIVETPLTRWLRPLLMVPPGRLRATLAADGVGWCEDPTNRDQAAQRARLRAYRADPDGGTTATHATAEAARARGLARAAAERATARWLAAHAEIHPLGYATIPRAEMPPAALAALLRAVSGAPRPPRAGVAALASAPRPATLGGVRLLPGGRLAPGRLLLIRESRAMGESVPALPGAVWDGRFRLGSEPLPPHATLGALGGGALLLPDLGLPAALRATLPAIRVAGALVAVPHLNYLEGETLSCRIWFSPAASAAGAPFGFTPDGWTGAEPLGVPSVACDTMLTVSRRPREGAGWGRVYDV